MSQTPDDFTQQCHDLRLKIFSTVAHDFNTPLACIIGALETIDQMRDQLSSQQQQMLITIALEQAQQLFAVVAGVLQNAQPQ